MAKAKKIRKETLPRKYLSHLKAVIMTLKSTKFMDSISVRVSKCSEISSPIVKIKFQHKWIIDSQLSKCEETRIW